MTPKLYIGAEQADFNEAFNVMFSIGDIRTLESGNANKSYSIYIPLTKTNKRLLAYINQADVKSEAAGTARLYLGEILIISGTASVLGTNDYAAKVLIDSDDWMDPLKESKLAALDLSAFDHVLNPTNVEASWSASYPAYRYPMINYGALMSLENGATARWTAPDFVPMISVARLITEILKPYSITSTWLAAAWTKDLYILGNEILATDGWLLGKGLNVKVTLATDNQQSGTSSTFLNVNFSKQVELYTTILDEGLDWVGNRYVVAEAGTYRFKAVMKFGNTGYGNANLTITNESVLVHIDKNGTEVCRTETGAYAGTELIHGVTYITDTFYIHCEIGDVISAHVYSVFSATVNSGSQTAVLNVTTDSTFENLWGAANRYAATGQNIQLEQYLPDMTKMDFLEAIKSIFNLRFWFDKQGRTIHIEPWDQFISSTVVDLTSRIITEENPAEMISQSYNKEIVLKWKDDTSDVATQEYLKINTFGPGRKSVTLSSIYAKRGTDYREHPWSSIITGPNEVTNGSVAVPRILNSKPISPYVVFDRMLAFNTRIVHWDGLTSGFSWNYEGTTKTQYPKISGLDFSTIYTDTWQKLFHYIDQGKIYTFRIKVDPVFINQFFAVIATATSEGFRPTYQVTINGIKNYFFLQKITSDGTIAEIELILKQ